MSDEHFNKSVKQNFGLFLGVNFPLTIVCHSNINKKNFIFDGGSNGLLRGVVSIESHTLWNVLRVPTRGDFTDPTVKKTLPPFTFSNKSICHQVIQNKRKMFY